MTRDEAYEIMETAFHYSEVKKTWEFNPNEFITVFQRLGILKLDQPEENAESRFLREIEGLLSNSDFTRVLASLAHHSCKIVKRK